MDMDAEAGGGEEEQNVMERSFDKNGGQKALEEVRKRSLSFALLY